MIFSRRSFDSVPVRLRLTDEEIGRFAVHRYEFPGVDLATRQTRHYPLRRARRCMPGLRQRHQRAGSGAHRSRHLRRHHADRQARRRERLRAAAARQERLSRDPGQCAGPLGAARRRAYAPNCTRRRPIAGEDLVLSIDLADPAGRGRRRSAITAARWSRSTRATATCWRWRASRASTRRRSRAGCRAANTRRCPTISTSRCSIARCAAPIRPARPSSR